MLITKDTNVSRFQIQSFQPGSVKINLQLYTHNILILGEQLMSPWGPKLFSELSAKDFEIILEQTPDVLLIGTGINSIVPTESLLRPLFLKGIGVEFMDSFAASRTYMALAAEGRSVSLALFVN